MPNVALPEPFQSLGFTRRETHTDYRPYGLVPYDGAEVFVSSPSGGEPSEGDSYWHVIVVDAATGETLNEFEIAPTSADLRACYEYE